MSDTDTSAEMVRKLIAETRSIPDTLPQWRKGDPVWLVRARWWMPRMANVAEALLDQREAALSQYRAVVENGLRFQAERDAARAEAEKLRRLWTYMQEAAADPDADEPLTAAEWLAEFADVEAKTRAALAAKEPGHE